MEGLIWVVFWVLYGGKRDIEAGRVHDDSEFGGLKRMVAVGQS